FVCFFFSSRRRHTRFSRDWSSDVCSSDLVGRLQQRGIEVAAPCLDVEDLLRDLAGETDLVILSRPEVAAEYLPLVRRLMPGAVRSEERRVGKEGRCGWAPCR